MMNLRKRNANYDIESMIVACNQVQKQSVISDRDSKEWWSYFSSYAAEGETTDNRAYIIQKKNLVIKINIYRLSI
jgi:hypothetical protein